jgi:hypothetical protein
MTQTNLNKLLKTLEVQESEFNVKKYLAVSMERLGMDFKNISLTTNDIITEFNYMSLKQIREALRNGSLGKYGRTYKLSTQEVCFWIREYLKANKNKLGL